LTIKKYIQSISHIAGKKTPKRVNVGFLCITDHNYRQKEKKEKKLISSSSSSFFLILLSFFFSPYYFPLA
jgi:hypothetical protein